MSKRSIATFAAAATAVALLTPIGLATAAESGTGEPDLVQVTGHVRVLAGEGGDHDSYSLELLSGRLIALAPGFEADPHSLFSGTLEVPASEGGETLTGGRRTNALRDAETSHEALVVRDSGTSAPRPAPGPAAHTTYIAKLTNLGAYSRSDTDILAQINAAQQYWLRESGGVIPTWSTASAVTATTSAAATVAGGCGLGNGGAEFGAIAQDVGGRLFPGVDFSGESPNHLVVVVPDDCANSVAVGRARLGMSFANGGPSILMEQTGNEMTSTMEHEYGHNVGLQHANNARSEYGDLYEVMGSGIIGYAAPALGTLYRWEQGIVVAGEVANGDAGGTFTLAPRSASSGQRSVSFIDPDTGKRVFVDYRNGTGVDQPSYYAIDGGPIGRYGQSYWRGIVIEREDNARGAFLMDVAGNDGVLQTGEVWSNAGGSVTVRATTANTVQVTRIAKPALPAGTASIAGTPRPYEEVTATAAISGATAFRYQWSLNGQPVPQADEATFTPTLAMSGATLSVAVTGHAVGYTPSSTAQSTPVTVAGARWYSRSGGAYPTISGTPRMGEVLTATGIDWVDRFGGKPQGYATSYAWLRNGSPIAGAGISTYQLQAADANTRIQVREYPVAPGFDTSAYAGSDATLIEPAPVALTPTPVPQPSLSALAHQLPRIKGKVAVGKVVKAATPGWTTGTTFRYQWFANGKRIKKATKKKFVIARSLRRAKLQVQVTGSKAGYVTVKAKSKKVRIR